MVAALLTHEAVCGWTVTYSLYWIEAACGQSSTLFIGLRRFLRFLVPVKRFHNEWSLHFINAFPASIEMGFSLSPD